jgi:hypothetical protein
MHLFRAAFILIFLKAEFLLDNAKARKLFSKISVDSLAIFCDQT